MPIPTWHAFRADVRGVVRETGGIVSETYGTGYYDGDTEDTYLVVSDGSGLDRSFEQVGEDVDGEPLGWWEARTRDLYASLGKLAARYGQESIAVAIADPVFVAGETFADGS